MDGRPRLWAALRPRLRGRAHPLVCLPDRVVPAASLWTGARAWSAAFRSAGLVRGDGVRLALPPSPAFVWVSLACLWDGLTLVLEPPSDAPAPASRHLPTVALTGAAHFRPTADGNPPEAPAWPLPHAPTRDAVEGAEAAVWVLEGPAGAPRWTVLLPEALAARVAHARHAGALSDGTRLVSLHPWWTVDGLVELLAGLLHAGEVHRLPPGADVLAHMAREGLTAISALPFGR